MAEGRSQIFNYLHSPDTDAMIKAMRQFGARIEKDSVLQIEGVAGQLKPLPRTIECGNSGQVLRFVGALAALCASETIFTGDESIQSRRPVGPLIGALKQLGAEAAAPLKVRGPLKGGSAALDGQDSQPISALLIASAFAPHQIEIEVTNPGETPWIDLTLDWFKWLNIPFMNRGHSWYRMEGNATIKSFRYIVPGDFSTAAFPIAAALLTHSELTLQNIDMNDIQGDKAIIPILQEMGAVFEIEGKTLTVKKSPRLNGMRIDVNRLIDALPILAVIGCFAEGRTELFNGKIARLKESDRIHAIATELKKMGAQIEETEEGLIIESAPLHGAELMSYRDHRIALSLSVAAMAAKGESVIHGMEAADKTYPGFVREFQSIGAQIK
jgi:3-phosphoshikimate 1-carboxyvinyltransferase